MKGLDHCALLAALPIPLMALTVQDGRLRNVPMVMKCHGRISGISDAVALLVLIEQFLLSLVLIIISF